MTAVGVKTSDKKYVYHWLGCPCDECESPESTWWWSAILPGESVCPDCNLLYVKRAGCNNQHDDLASAKLALRRLHALLALDAVRIHRPPKIKRWIRADVWYDAYVASRTTSTMGRLMDAPRTGSSIRPGTHRRPGSARWPLGEPYRE